ncbi:ROK family transcriptional regulator [Actinoalloteichus hymeniacidonis]|uniref:Transcriptional regulator/sugar kinase n=1 Tax=Actinoalloteichus hymeniacidonis TaxID=340345 RepID=A0AAC9HNK0_9PSEU|nr:ROK family transcriptional regulator [Actinoalloteichus hymeniacidonis]AOS62575.1 transcriptional regulator/sugar kinase [Actinoalloteichus hymeniacidonis]MBB5909394.1 putative NBD/HSP70 family sugar kinase [Actinoalloteichus hymeniacidonis]
MRGGANLPLVGTYNRGVVLETIRSSGSISRVELTALTGLTAPTVSNIVRRLIDDELVIEAGQGRSTGGKRRTLLTLNPDACYAVGVRIDPRGAVCVVVDLAGRVVAAARLQDSGTTPEEIIRGVAEEIGALLDSAGIDIERVIGVGVAAPGPLDHGRGVVLDPPNMTQWHDVALRDELAAALNLPVMIDNDATAAAVGEHWLGRANQSRNFASIYMGTGIGAGIFIDGQVYRGATSNVGELGHISLDVDGAWCFCGNRGCVELFSAPPAIVAAALAAGPEAAQLALSGSPRDVRTDFAAISTAAALGSPYAVSLIERSARYLATGVLTLVNLLDLDLVVLGGPAFERIGHLYVAAIEDILATRAFARRGRPPRTVLSALGADVSAVGSAALVLHSEFAPQLLDGRTTDLHSKHQGGASGPA